MLYYTTQTIIYEVLLTNPLLVCDCRLCNSSLLITYNFRCILSWMNVPIQHVHHDSMSSMLSHLGVCHGVLLLTCALALQLHAVPWPHLLISLYSCSMTIKQSMLLLTIIYFLPARKMQCARLVNFVYAFVHPCACVSKLLCNYMYVITMILCASNSAK